MTRKFNSSKTFLVFSMKALMSSSLLSLSHFSDWINYISFSFQYSKVEWMRTIWKGYNKVYLEIAKSRSSVKKSENNCQEICLTSGTNSGNLIQNFCVFFESFYLCFTHYKVLRTFLNPKTTFWFFKRSNEVYISPKSKKDIFLQ